MNLIKKKQQMDYITLQFQQQMSLVPNYIKPSLKRFETFLKFHSNTDVFYLNFVDKYHLIEYFQYHAARGFSEISFTQTIKDIRHLKSFLNYYGGNQNDLNFELTIEFLSTLLTTSNPIIHPAKKVVS